MISLSTAKYLLCVATHIDLYKKHCISNVRTNYFSNRVIDVWNSLPLTVGFSTLHSFKYSTERVDFKQFLVCD